MSNSNVNLHRVVNNSPMKPLDGGDSPRRRTELKNATSQGSLLQSPSAKNIFTGTAQEDSERANRHFLNELGPG